MVNSSKICSEKLASDSNNFTVQMIKMDCMLMKIEQQESYVSSLKTSMKNANDDLLKCELEKEVTTTRIILANSTEISPENQFNGCQDFIRKIDGISREIQQREAYIKSLESEFIDGPM